MAWNSTKVDDTTGMMAADWNTMVASVLHADGSVKMIGDLDVSRNDILNITTVSNACSGGTVYPFTIQIFTSNGSKVFGTEFGTDGNKTIHSNVNNDVSLGTSGLKWSNVFATTVTEGDHAFTETYCVKCNKDFKLGENIIFRVIRFEEGRPHTIPIHLECSNKPKVKFTRQEAVKEDIYIFNDKKGKVEKITQNKTQKVKYLKKKLKDGFSLGKDGNIYKNNKKTTLTDATDVYEDIEDEVVYQDVEYEV